MMKHIHLNPKNKEMHCLLSTNHQCTINPLIKKTSYHFSEIDNNDLFAHLTHFSTKVWTKFVCLTIIINLEGTLCLALPLKAIKIEI